MKVESLYVHFPFCRHLCNYCDFHKSVIESSKVDSFNENLSYQLKKNSEFISKNEMEFSSLKTLYIGGGTPSLWGDKGIEFLIKELKKNRVSLSSDTEFTLELNPGAWTEESIVKLVELGVNRFSVGVQSLNTHILKKLDRIHSLDDVYRTLELLKKLNVNYSVDFMLGLPSYEKRNIFEEIDEVVKYGPSHISSYILTVNKNYVHSNELPNEDFISNEYLEFVEYLKKYEIFQYEVSNFSKNGFESKHNLQYWKSNSVAAVGPSATGFLAKDESAIRYRWKTGEASIDFSIEELDSSTLNFERIYLALRCAVNLDLASFFSADNQDAIGSVCKAWKLKGFSVGRPSSLTLTAKGFLLLDSLFSDLFKYLKN